MLDYDTQPYLLNYRTRLLKLPRARIVMLDKHDAVAALQSVDLNQQAIARRRLTPVLAMILRRSRKRFRWDQIDLRDPYEGWPVAALIGAQ